MGTNPSGRPSGSLQEHLDDAIDLGSGLLPAAYKLRQPLRRSGSVSRTRLVRRLDQDTAEIVVVTTPAGYGKTTLVTEWAASDGRPCAWLSVEPTENDPHVLLTYLALALDRVEPLAPSVVSGLLSTSRPMSPSVLPRFARMLSERRVPLVLVLDDVHHLVTREALDILAVLVAALPAGSRLAFVGRTRPDLHFGRLRVKKDVLELGAADLALDLGEAVQLFEAADVALSVGDVDVLLQRTEGWATALHLAALSLRSQGRGTEATAVGFTGDQTLMAEYLRDEFLDDLDAETSRFLLDASCLERLSGPLCDAALARQGSAVLLERLERQNLLLVPLDDRHNCYRLHHLLRDLLRSEMQRCAGGAATAIHRRASKWFEDERDIEAAVAHAWSAGDTDRVQALVAAHFGAFISNGRTATVEAWLRRFEQDDLLTDPLLAIFVGQTRLTAGDGDAALEWLARAERLALAESPQEPEPVESAAVLTPTAALALFRALVAPMSAGEIAESARYALARVPSGAYRAHTAIIAGVADYLLGEDEAAEAAYDLAIVEAQDAPTALALALAHRAALDVERGAWDAATTLGRRARSLMARDDLESLPTMVMVTAVSSLVEARAGRRRESESDRLLTRRNLIGYTHVSPAQNVLVRVCLVRASMLMGDRAGARTCLDEADRFLEVVSDATRVKDQLAELGRELVGAGDARSYGPSSLTLAEMRVLVHLCTHLSLAEIADRLYVSRNTVKSQSISIYRKLGTSSRSGAVAVARDAGLLADGG